MCISPADQRSAPGRSVRRFVWIFLAVFLICGAVGLEAWPFSGFRLFSSARTDTAVVYGIVRTDAGGAQTPFPVSSLPPAYGGLGSILRNGDPVSGLCPLYLDAIRKAAPDTVAIRVVRTVQRLDAGGRPPAVLSVQEVGACAD